MEVPFQSTRQDCEARFVTASYRDLLVDAKPLCFQIPTVSVAHSICWDPGQDPGLHKLCCIPHTHPKSRETTALSDLLSSSVRPWDQSRSTAAKCVEDYGGGAAERVGNGARWT